MSDTRSTTRPPVKTERSRDAEARSETPKEIWEVGPDPDVDQRPIITDWASI